MIRRPGPGASQRGLRGLVSLARIGRPHGLRGELRVRPYHPESDLITRLTHVVARQSHACCALEITSVRPHRAPLLLLGFSGILDRQAASRLTGYELCAGRGQLPPLARGEYYHVDLVGLQVRDIHGSPLGIVRGVEPYPSVDVVLVDGHGVVREVPMIAPYLISVDVDRGAMVVQHFLELPVVPRPKWPSSDNRDGP